MKLRVLAAICAAALAAQFNFAPHAFAAEAADSAANEHWVSAWGTALQSIPQLASLPPLYRAPDVAGRTVRQLIYPQLDGKRMRLRISNLYGTEPLVIASMSVARATG